MTTIDENGVPQQWTAVYWQHYSKLDLVCDSFAEAYHFLDSGEDYGELASHAILGPDGNVLMDKKAIHAAQLNNLNPDDLLRELTQRAIAGGTR